MPAGDSNGLPAGKPSFLMAGNTYSLRGDGQAVIFLQSECDIHLGVGANPEAKRRVVDDNTGLWKI